MRRTAENSGHKPGHRVAGRKKGTPNKRSSLVGKMLENMECDPVGVAAAICNDTSEDSALRLKAALGLMEYLYPKRKAIEVTGANDGPVKLILEYENEPD